MLKIQVLVKTYYAAQKLTVSPYNIYKEHMQHCSNKQDVMTLVLDIDTVCKSKCQRILAGSFKSLILAC